MEIRVLTKTKSGARAFAYAMRITCIVAACCAVAALVLSLVKGKVGKDGRGGDMENAF